MKIDSASYSLASNRVARSRDEISASFRASLGDPRTARALLPAGAGGPSLSPAARAALANEAASSGPARDAGTLDDAADAAGNDPFLSLIISMIEAMTGRKVRVFSSRDMPRAPAAEGASTQAAGSGFELDVRTVHEESERTTVSAKGIVRTADGRTMAFSLDLSMARSQREETTLSLRAGNAARKDPLVLNFNGAAARLSDQSFAFDLDSDGTKEQVAMLAGGSGYLAIDRNGNGRVDAGSELFGPATDSGFGELARLDDDGNGWIDENDAAFGRLWVWSPAADGGGALDSLAARGVGAIASGHVASRFELRGSGNADLGAVAASGLFLTEDGRAGSVQEIDLTV